jgi:hypothetical protein
MVDEQADKQANGSVSGRRAEFLSRAGQAFDRMFGTDGQNGLVTFQEREDRACEVTDELARWLMAGPQRRHKRRT